MRKQVIHIWVVWDVFHNNLWHFLKTLYHRKGMRGTREKLVNERIAATYEGKSYILLKKCNGQKMNNLEKAVKELIAENDLTVTQAKGFLRYMRILIEECSCLPKEK